jgi:hypothetical protein
MALNISPAAQPATASSTSTSGTNAVGTTQQDAQSQLNLSIVQASLSVSITTQNQPLTLVFKTAIDKINAALEPTLGPNAIQNAVSQDNTPQGTAGRIVALSTGFFGAYQQQHPELSQPDALKNFMAIIESGFQQGLSDAKNILQGLQVLNGSIASNIDQTAQLVQQGYDAFVAANSPLSSATNQSKPTTAGISSGPALGS